MPDPSPILSDVLELVVNKRLVDVYIHLPGRIESYDSVTQRADVQPLVKIGVIDPETGERVARRPPPCVNVPVIHHGAGGYRTTYPVQRGDECLLEFCSSSIDKWKAVGGEVDPGDDRRFSFSDAVAVMGLRARPWLSAPADIMTAGRDGGPVIEYDRTEIRVGGIGAQPALLGNSFLTAFATLVTAVATAVGSSGTPASATSAGAAIESALQTFQAAAASYLTAIARVR